MDGNNPGHAKRVELLEFSLAAGATRESSVFNLYSYGRIVGTLYSNQVLAVQILQGPTSTTYGDAGESWNSTGNADLGAGDLFSHLNRSPEGYCRIRVRNTGASTATVRLQIGLTNAS